MRLSNSNVMVDLETLGKNSNAVIISLGAVIFNESRITGSFYRKIDAQSCVDAGLKMDVSTIMWWMEQSDAARAEFKNTKSSLTETLLDFSEWFPKEACLWGNGATFDNVILGNAYDSLRFERPWQFWSDRCYRTVKALYPQVSADPFAGVAHNALDDARHQALHLIKIAGAV